MICLALESPLVAGLPVLHRSSGKGLFFEQGLRLSLDA